MLVFFVSFFSLFFKWRRLLFVLISFEFILIGFFFVYSFVFGGMMMLFFICFSVITSLFGLVVVLVNVFVFGSDLCLF
uniref:NADH dehydrogenase subunit 4L n=1 Tax=Passalurus ambiguus TaxID=451380 RepID=A0A0P0I377_PASAG|nr:NADH dehydrogenase subunit 4L [Passalurus ambiguus]ALJ93256.1 NADH dehydrogenase subunit 4L [Passalurus ambiguus]